VESQRRAEESGGIVEVSISRLPVDVVQNLRLPDLMYGRIAKLTGAKQ